MTSTEMARNRRWNVRSSMNLGGADTQLYFRTNLCFVSHREEMPVVIPCLYHQSMVMEMSHDDVSIRL